MSSISFPVDYGELESFFSFAEQASSAMDCLNFTDPKLRKTYGVLDISAFWGSHEKDRKIADSALERLAVSLNVLRQECANLNEYFEGTPRSGSGNFDEQFNAALAYSVDVEYILEQLTSQPHLQTFLDYANTLQQGTVTKISDEEKLQVTNATCKAITRLMHEHHTKEEITSKGIENEEEMVNHVVVDVEQRLESLEAWTIHEGGRD